MTLLLARLALAALIATTFSMESFAAYPERPVKVIVPWPAGGAADLPVRNLTEGLQRKLGQAFVIENRAGAGGSVGVEAAVRATPDGYTLMANTNSSMLLLPLIRKVNYKASDLVPIAVVGDSFYAIGVLPNRGMDTLEEMVARAKANPGQLSYSSPGIGSVTNLRFEAFKHLAGVDILHVPYRSGAEALNDFMAGTVSMMFDTVFFPQVRSGQAKMLAVFGARRHPDFPDVRSFSEAGYPIEILTWHGFYAPLGTPQVVIDTVAKAVKELNAEPEIRQRQISVGWMPFEAQPEELLARQNRAIDLYREWIEKLNFQGQ